MFSLSTHCSVCHNEREAMSKVHKNDKQIIKGLACCGFQTDWLDSNMVIFICYACSAQLQATVDFVAICRRNSALLSLYFTPLDTKSLLEDTIPGDPSEEDLVFVILDNEHVEIDQNQLQHVPTEYEKFLENESVQGRENRKNAEEDTMNRELLVETEQNGGYELRERLLTDYSSITKEPANQENMTTLEERNDGVNATEKEPELYAKRPDVQEVLITEDKENEDANTEKLFRDMGIVVLDSILVEEQAFAAEGYLDLYKAKNCGNESNGSGQKVRAKTARKRLVQCEVCHKSFNGRTKCEIHMRTHTGEKPFVCKFCDKRYTRVDSLNDHILTHGQKPFKCTECGAAFLFRNSFKKHQAAECVVKSKAVAAHTQRFKCVLCNDTFASNVLLANHTAAHNVATNKCPECGGVFASQVALNEHIAAHYDAVEFKCLVCNKEFKTNRAFRRHLLIHYNLSIECTVCNKKFSSELLLERHKLLHGGEEPHTCSVCAKTFLFKYQLSHHMHTHTGKEFACLVCGKVFYFRSRLKRHLLIHTLGKPYKCTVCSKHFSSAQYLKSHQAFHSGEKPYECTNCHKRFTIRQGLYNHKLVCMSMGQ